tara:strand:+ start:29991 stop:30800 length:810 start_codon:yes stop_codon:yes gene_type:complete
MKILNILLCTILTSVNGFNTIQTKTKNVLKSSPIEVVPNKVEASILFFPGKLFRNIPKEMYNGFVSKLNNNYDVSIAKDNMNENKELLESSENICIVSHSTSANDVVELIKKTNITSKVIFIDPIEYVYFKNENYLDNYNFDMNNLEEQISEFLEANKIDLFFKSVFKKEPKMKPIDNSVLVLQSKMSNMWRVFPPVPPLNKYSLDLKQLKNKQIDTIDDYGHYDILDSSWANLMHNSVSKGAKNRDDEFIEEYQSKLVDKINTFINSD